MNFSPTYQNPASVVIAREIPLDLSTKPNDKPLVFPDSTANGKGGQLISNPKRLMPQLQTFNTLPKTYAKEYPIIPQKELLRSDQALHRHKKAAHHPLVTSLLQKSDVNTSASNGELYRGSNNVKPLSSRNHHPSDIVNSNLSYGATTPRHLPQQSQSYSATPIFNSRNGSDMVYHQQSHLRNALIQKPALSNGHNGINSIAYSTFAPANNLTSRGVYYKPNSFTPSPHEANPYGMQLGYNPTRNNMSSPLHLNSTPKPSPAKAIHNSIPSPCLPVLSSSSSRPSNIEAGIPAKRYISSEGMLLKQNGYHSSPSKRPKTTEFHHPNNNNNNNLHFGKVITPLSSPIIKRKDNPQTAKDFPLVIQTNGYSTHISSLDKLTTGIFENGGPTPYKTYSKNEVTPPKDNNTYATKSRELYNNSFPLTKQILNSIPDSDLVAPPCLEAMKPEEGRGMQALHDNSPLSPPLLTPCQPYPASKPPSQSPFLKFPGYCKPQKPPSLKSYLTDTEKPQFLKEVPPPAIAQPITTTNQSALSISSPHLASLLTTTTVIKSEPLDNNSSSQFHDEEPSNYLNDSLNETAAKNGDISETSTSFNSEQQQTPTAVKKKRKVCRKRRPAQLPENHEDSPSPKKSANSNKSQLSSSSPNTQKEQTKRGRKAIAKYVLKRFNKNAAYEQELQKEEDRLMKSRSRKRLRQQILAKLENKERSSDTSPEKPVVKKIKTEPKEPLPPQEDATSTPQTVIKAEENGTKFGTRTPWKRRKRHHKRNSGLDMIIRRKKPKVQDKHKDSSLENEEKKSRAAEISNTPITHSYLKKFIVNKSLGETVLHRAARMGLLDMVQFCLRVRFCDVNARDNAGYMPLHEACNSGQYTVAKVLLEYGADPNKNAQGGIRPLHDAIENDHVEIARLLLAYGADPTVATYSGVTPIKMAKSKGMMDLLQGYFDDFVCSSETGWEFNGTSTCTDLNSLVLFEDVPSDHDDENEEDSFLFEISERPLLPTYSVNLPEHKLPDTCLMLSDILERLCLEKGHFVASYGDKVEMVEMSSRDFEANVACNQLLCSKFGVVPSTTSITLVKIDSTIRSLLEVETEIVR